MPDTERDQRAEYVRGWWRRCSTCRGLRTWWNKVRCSRPYVAVENVLRRHSDGSEGA